MNLGYEVQLGSGLSFNPQNMIGSGAFGEIYSGTSRKGEEIAIKIESSTSQNPLLEREAKILEFLKGGKGIPDIKSFFDTGEYNCLIMDLLGPNIETMLNYFNRQLQIITCLQLGLQMLERIEFIHSRHFIHRDIKPENFLLGTNKHINRIYLIDYGLSKRFRNRKTGLHIPYKDGKSITGTPKYVSIYTHLGIEQSRRDDLESLGYVLIYLMKGELPWENVKAKTKEDRFNKILCQKLAISIDELCVNLPSNHKPINVFIDEMGVYLNIVRSMQFEEKPDYLKLKELFSDMIKHLNNKEDDNQYPELYIEKLINEHLSSSSKNKKQKKIS